MINLCMQNTGIPNPITATDNRKSDFTAVLMEFKVNRQATTPELANNFSLTTEYKSLPTNIFIITSENKI